MEGKQTVTCKICSENVSKYKCPKCSVDYCSIDCYKSVGHSQCSENFYRQCFMEGLKDSGVDQSSKRKFQDMLLRLQEQLSDVDMSDLSGDFKDPAFVDDLDQKGKELWDALSSEEKRTFCEIQNEGDFSNLIELWEPWWVQVGATLIEDQSHMEELMKKIPPLHEANPELIAGKNWSDKLCFTLVNVIYGYAYVMRLHNGDCTDMPLELALGLQSISGGLGDSVFTDASQAVGHCTMSLNGGSMNAGEFFVSNEYSLAVIQDVVCMIKGPNCFRPTLYVESCLSHSLQIFIKANKILRKERNKKDSKLTPTEIEDWHKLFFRARKKLEFLISWVAKFGHIVSDLSHTLEVELHEQMSSLSLMKNGENLIRGVLSENRTSLIPQPKISEL